MPQDIIPDSHENRLNFFKNLQQELAANAATLKLDPARLASINALLTALTTDYQALVAAEAAVVATSADAAQTFSTNSAALRDIFNELKNNPQATDGMIAAMGLFTQTTQRQPQDIQPRLRATARPGHVTITGSKDYAELINIYVRLLGTTGWTLVGVKRKKFPFDDQTPLKTPGVPEVREYMARGVIDDEEIGQQSDIVQVTFVG